MYLTRHATPTGPRWASDGVYLPEQFTLSVALGLPRAQFADFVRSASTGVQADGAVLAPLDAGHEVWACGVTYLRSREARVVESQVKDVYEKVYDAERVEVFFKSLGWRAVGHGEAVRIRADSHWNVPEPELTLVINRNGEVVGYTAGNDMSSRDIEGENPLYLPQAKVYDGSCAVGPGIEVTTAESMGDIGIRLRITRDGNIVFDGKTNTNELKRTPGEMADYLGRELEFPSGAFLMTGAGIVPPDDFTLLAEDVVTIDVGSMQLENRVAANG